MQLLLEGVLQSRKIYVFRALKVSRLFLSGLVLLILFQASTAFAKTDYYISSSQGNDSWSGRLPEPNQSNSDGPKQSVDAAQTIASNLTPGDRLLFRRGDSWTGISNLISLSTTAGEANREIIIGAYGNGDKPRFDVTGEGSGIFIRGANDAPTAYLRIENIHIMTTGTPGNRPTGITVIETFRPNNPHHIVFDGLTLEGLKFGANIQENDITITNCLIQNNYGIPPETGHTQGIYAKGSRIIITKNTLKDNGKPGVGFDHNTYLSNCIDCIYSDNVVSGGFSGLKIRKGRGITVTGNRMYNLDYSTITVGADAGATISAVEIDGNTLFNTGRGINVKAQSEGASYIDDLVIKNNIIYGTTTAGITLHSTYIKSSALYNNLVYNNGSGVGISVRSSTIIEDLLAIKNCILANTRGQTGTLLFMEDWNPGKIALDHTLYYSPSASIARIGSDVFSDLGTLQTRFPEIAQHAMEQDPQFSNPPEDFRPQNAEAPSVDNGASLIGIVDNDHDGNSRPFIIHTSSSFSWDIGPFEFRGKYANRPEPPNNLQLQ